MQPKVSVVIPIYNVEKYLRKCLDTVITQTLRELEIILVDDGSTDSSGDICDEYEKKDSRIKVIHQVNQYVGIARNNGMDIATGEYIIFLDSDDFFEPEMLEEMYSKAKENDLDIVLCKEQAYYEKENCFAKLDFVQGIKYIPQKEIFNGDDIPDYIFNFCIAWPWDKLYKLSFLREYSVIFPVDRAVIASEDLVFVCHAFALAKKIMFLPKVFITHRYHSKSLGANRNSIAASLSVYMLEERLKQSNLYEKYQKSFINLAFDNILWSLSVASKKNYKEELKYTKEAFKYFEIEKYDKSYFYDTDKYEYYENIKNPVNVVVSCLKQNLRHIVTILSTQII